MDSQGKEFLTELEALLLKYKATIDYDFSGCADTHGLGDSGMALYVGAELVASFPYESCLSYSDIREVNSG